MKKGQRIHGIDALRAIAMLLGVVFHATLAYKVKRHGGYQPHDDQFHHWIFDLSGFFMHSFRMPLFFLIAGYFCRFLYYKIGELPFIRHRWKRVGIPFFAGIILIVPLSLFPCFMYEYIYKSGLSWHEAWKSSFLRMFRLNGVYHLWFLYDLLMYYTVVVVVMRLKNIAFIGNLFTKFSLWWSRVSLTKGYWIVILSLPVWLILFFYKDFFVFVDVYLIPRHLSYILFYGYLFGLGWLLEKRQDAFAILIRNRTLFLTVGAIICLLLFYVEWNKATYYTTIWWSAGKLAAAFQVILFSLGFIGFFLHYFNVESYFWRYVSDASYWVYLTHLGLIVWLQLLFLDSNVPGILRFPLVLGVSTLITFLTYQWFIRYTFVGDILHGPRKRRKQNL